MNELTTVPFGPTAITRLISGGGQLCGNSHFTEELSEDMRSYFTDEQVVRYLHDVERAGINTLLARADYHRTLHWLELYRREGGRLHWIAQTASEMSDVFQNIRITAQAGAIGIYHHGTQTDRWWLEGRIDNVEDYLKCIRDCGVRVGLGTHHPEVIEYAEEKGWDVDFYMACFYNINRKPRESRLVAPGQIHAEEDFREDDPPAMCKVIRQTQKTCLAFKILGAGRKCATQDDVRAAFDLAFRNIKATDAVVVGMFPKYVDQITLNVRYALQACETVGETK